MGRGIIFSGMGFPIKACNVYVGRNGADKPCHKPGAEPGGISRYTLRIRPCPAPMPDILALSGSLRAASINTALLQATAALAPPSVRVTLYDGVGRLPLFNPDLDPAQQAEVEALRLALNAADAVIIASPEYAHGVSGVMKNLLDWMVGCEAFVDKPVAVFNASPRAQHADEAIKEILRTMSARVVPAACVAVPLLGARLDLSGMVLDAGLATRLRQALAALCE